MPTYLPQHNGREEDHGIDDHENKQARPGELNGLPGDQIFAFYDDLAKFS
jgi:hypothetical protein